MKVGIPFLFFYFIFLNNLIAIEKKQIEEVIKKGDLKELVKIVDQGIDLEKKYGDEEYSLVHIAVKYRKKEIIQYLISKKVNINALGKNKETPLHLAAFEDTSDIAEILIKNGALVNAQDTLLQTPLHFAVMMGKKEVISVLIRNGAKVEAMDLKKRSPLYYPAIDSNKDMIEFLFSLGVDVNVKIENHSGFLHFFAANKSEKSIDLLNYLISLGAEVNIKDEFGRSPLHRAAFNFNFDACKLLISAGANVNMKDDYGYTPLHNAILDAEKSTYNILKEKKVINPDLKSIYKTCDLLIKSGADVNAQTNGGATPLHLAVDAEKLDIVKLLVENGAKIDVVGELWRDKGTPMYFAKKYKYKKIYKYLEQKSKEQKKNLEMQKTF